MPRIMPALWAATFAIAAVAEPAISQPAQPQTAPDAAVVREAERRMDVIEKNQALIEELAGMSATDQLVRNRWLELRKTADEPTRQALEDVWARRIAPIDAAHVRRIKQLLAARDEWFRISEVGSQGANAAFLIVQHANDLALQKEVLAKMEPLLASGDVRKSDYALLYDRVAIQEGRPQRYATQGTDCDGDKYAIPRNLEDPAHLDARRAEMGLDPIASYLDGMNRMYGRCEVPPVMRNRTKTK